MATVGINFGSASSGAGFDVATTVTSILAIEQGVETPWKAQLTTLQARDTALSGLGTKLASLSSAVSSLTAFDGVLASKQGSSSDTTTLSLTSASTTANAGSHTIQVTSLASTSSDYSDRITNTSDTLSGSLSIQIGSGTAKTLTIDSTNNTLSTLVQAINNGGYGVTASVVTDTQGSRLSLVSANSGAAGQITLGGGITDATTSTAINFTQGQPGADAQLVVDGLSTTSASNTVTGAIPGVTFQLLKSSPNTNIQVQITNDNSSIETAFSSLVTAYNATVAALATQEGKDSTGVAEPLYGSPTLAFLQQQLASAISGGSAQGSIKSPADLGLTLGLDGTLTLDNNKLDAALNSNFGDVNNFLQSSGSFGLNLSKTLNGLSSTSSQGAIYLALAENSTQESGINDNIAKVEARVAIDKTTLTTQLNLANQILQSIPEQLTEVNQIYSALTGYNQQK